MSIPVSNTNGGGALSPNPLVDIILQKSLSATDLVRLARTETAAGRQETYVVDNNQVSAAFVSEEGAKPLADLSWTTKSVNIKKLAVISVFSDELLSDAQYNPQLLAQPKVSQSFARLIDAHLLGYENGSPIAGGTEFDDCLADAAHNVNLDTTKADGIRRAISAAMGKLEESGYGDNLCVVLATDARQIARDIRSTLDETAAPFGSPSDLAYGLPLGFSQNLTKLSDAPGTDSVVGVVFDPSQLIVKVRSDMAIDVSTEASLTKADDSRLDLFQQNLTAVRFEARIGAILGDENAACVITNNTEAPSE